MKIFNYNIKKQIVDSSDFLEKINKIKNKNIIIDIIETPIIINGTTRRREYTIIYKPKWWYIIQK